jgi:hypothetical protein
MARGGARPGSGRKKGSRWPATLDKEAAREVLREMVKDQLRPMTEAQIANAKGIKYLMVREASGKFVKVTEAMAGALAPEAIVEVWEERPNVQAFTDLLNRTIDMPAKPAEEVNAKLHHIFTWKDSE